MQRLLCIRCGVSIHPETAEGNAGSCMPCTRENKPTVEQRNERHLELKRRWDQVEPGMCIARAEEIMGFCFSIDSENKAGRIVYSNHAQDLLPFYLVVDRFSNKIIRRHEIRALDELSLRS